MSEQVKTPKQQPIQQQQPHPHVQTSKGETGETTTTTPSSKSKQSYQQQKVSIRQNFSDESENLINNLINNLFFGCYTCTSMAYYFDREDIGLFGLADFFRWCARYSYQCCRLLMDYIVVRGGEVQFDTIKKPEKTEWGKPLDALEYLIDLKKVINQQVLKVHNQACEQVDPHLADFLETVILRPLVEYIRKVGVLVANLQRAGPKLGEYQFNKDLELHLQQIMRDVKVSHLQLPITAVGAPVPQVTHGGLGSINYNYQQQWPVGSCVGLGQSPSGPTSTPGFNLTDVINLISNFGLNPSGQRVM